MSLSRKDKVVAVLRSIETGDPQPFSYINPRKYIQHNLTMPDGVEGIGDIVRSAPVGTLKARVVRAFEDGDMVFTHTEYDFQGPRVGFDIFRFEDGLIVEHWDNLQPPREPNGSRRTMLDGATEVRDTAKTAQNKALVEKFMTENMIDGAGTFADYVHPDLIQHNPDGADGLAGLAEMMKFFNRPDHTTRYDRVRMVLGQGNFVLIVCEGRYGPGAGSPTAFYDMFRVADGELVEHWDVLETIPPADEWANTNGKF